MAVSGLYRAPLVKLLLVLVPVLTLLSSSLAPLDGGPPLFALSRGAWRLPASLLACETVAEALCASLLLYRLRDFERQMGCVSLSLLSLTHTYTLARVCVCACVCVDLCARVCARGRARVRA